MLMEAANPEKVFSPILLFKKIFFYTYILSRIPEKRVYVVLCG